VVLKSRVLCGEGFRRTAEKRVSVGFGEQEGCVLTAQETAILLDTMRLEPGMASMGLRGGLQVWPMPPVLVPEGQALACRWWLGCQTYAGLRGEAQTPCLLHGSASVPKCPAFAAYIWLLVMLFLALAS
jgi:hypothetical protein